MKIKSLHIKNFKSIVDLEIIEPNPFTVFVGPNGAGKSNIFEALEFYLSVLFPLMDRLRLFGNIDHLKNRNIMSNEGYFKIGIDDFLDSETFSYKTLTSKETSVDPINSTIEKMEQYYIFRSSFLRLFINGRNQKVNYDDDYRLNFSASNLEKVLKRVLQDPSKKEEILDWLALFIPGFANIEIVSSELSGTDTLVVYEKDTKKPFTKDLLSDGTFNILALLTAVYQSDEPQFLCIEEPENGLHPEVIKELVGFFRAACAEKGHYIWLNTHSQTLVYALRPQEIILVNKRQGETQIKQLKNKDLHGLTMDEAWLSNALGGGLTW